MPNGGFRQLSEVQDFLLDVSIYDHLDSLAETYKIPQDRLGELLQLAEAVIRDQLQVEQMPEFLGKAFGLEPDIAKKVACDLAGYRLLPLLEFIPGIDVSIKQWGGDVASYPSLRIRKPQPEDELGAFVKEIGLDLPDHLQKRFVFLAKGYISKERNRQATLTLLKRPITIGGLEMTDEQAEKLFQMLDERFGEGEKEKPVDPLVELPLSSSGLTLLRLGATEGLARGSSELGLDGGEGNKDVQDESQKSKVESVKPQLPVKQATRQRELLAIKAVPHALTTSVPVISGSIMHELEEQEIAKHKKILAQSAVPNDLAEKQEDIIKKTAQALFPLFKEARQTQQSAIELSRSYVKGMLDSQRANALLVTKFGITQESTYPILKILQAGYDELHKKPQVKKVVVDKKNDVAKQEQHLLDDRHAAITKTVARVSVEPVLPTARVSAAHTKQEELSASRKKINTGALREAQERSKPKKAVVKLSVQSTLQLKNSDAPTKVADISFSSNLIGPVEELGTMSIVEFRRLSSDPKEAIQKILNTLELLEEDDYEQRVKGIMALRKSPLQNLYISLVQEALLQGIPVADVATARRNKGEASLNAAEIEAIVKLNDDIRF
ncbi:hypothetical protein L6260_02935 [Candidatus Parcubacteria bacterium]|nr:hypothetical protein [Candidatus Parcubacteria bacterium]